MALYVPPNYCRSVESFLFFIGGPIQGTLRWHNEAYDILESEAADFLGRTEIDVASPRYMGQDEAKIGDWAPNMGFEAQIDWESYHLFRAGMGKGGILFWLAPEHKHYPERAFAQTSRFEIGEWVTKHIYEGAKVAVGIHPDFPGGGYINYRLRKEAPQIRIATTLEETCRNVLRLAAAQ